MDGALGTIPVLEEAESSVSVCRKFISHLSSTLHLHTCRRVYQSILP